MMMVAGLGNPGPAYHGTRHNVGFQVVALLADNLGIRLGRKGFRSVWGQGKVAGETLVLCQPLTYMNRSGTAVVPLLDHLHLELQQLLVVYDDLDLPVGKLRLRPQGGSGGHRGLGSIIRALGEQSFPRLRIGIGSPPPGIEPADYVLSPFDSQEVAVMESVLEYAARGVEMVIREGVPLAMNRINTWEPPGEERETGHHAWGQFPSTQEGIARGGGE